MRPPIASRRLAAVVALTVFGQVLALASGIADPIEFENFYPVGRHPNSALAVCQSSDGSFFIAGTDSNQGTVRWDIVTKIGATGQFQWTKRLRPSDQQSRLFGAVGMPNGGAAVTGIYNPTCCGGSPTNQLQIVHLDADGNFVWSYLGPTFTHGTSITRATNGDLIANGAYRTSSSGPFAAFIVRVTPAGNELWSHTLSGPSHPFINFPGSIIEAANGDLVGNAFTQVGGENYGVVFRLNAEGQPLWTTTLDVHTQIFSVTEAPDGTLMAAGSHFPPQGEAREYLAKLSAGGSVLWTLYPQRTAIHGISPCPAGGFYARTADIFPQVGADIVIRRIGYDGALIWEDHFGTTADDAVAGTVITTSDGGFATSFFVQPTMLSRGIYLIKGTTVPGDTVRVVSTTIASAQPTPVPVVHRGASALGVVSLYFDYDDALLSFHGVQSRVPGQTFSAAIANGRISVQWFDGTGGSDPILPQEDTLFVILLSATANDAMTRLTFHQGPSGLGDQNGVPILTRYDEDWPNGEIVLNVPISIAGRISYYWQDKDVPGTTLSLGAAVPDASSDGTGNYAFPTIPSGSYTLTPTKTNDLGGINSLDALKIVRHASGQETMTDPFKLIAADVTADAAINAFDAFRVVQAAIGLSALPSGNWKFSPSTREYPALEQAQNGQDFTAIRMGDVNGDWEPDPPPMPAAAAMATGPAMRTRATPTPTIVLPDTIVGVTATSVWTPVYVADLSQIGAISLRVAHDSSVLTYTSVTSLVQGVSFSANRVGNEVRIEWYDATGGANPITIGQGALLRINWTVAGEAGESTPLGFQPSCLLGDGSGNPVTGVGYADGAVELSSTVGVRPTPPRPLRFALGGMQPNPFREHALIRYEIPERSAVRLRIFDARGALVKSLEDRVLEAGEYSVIWAGTGANGAPASPGLYFIHLEAAGRSATRKVVRTN